LEERSHLKDRQPDFIANVHVLGPRVQISGYHEGRELRATLSVYKDFAMVRSFAIDSYVDQGNSKEGMLSVIQKRNYYHGHGHTSQAQLEYRGRYWNLGALITHTETEVIKDRDRFKETVTVNPDIEDRRRRKKVWIEFKPNRRLGFEISLEDFSRAGEIAGGYKNSASEPRVMGQIKYKL
jgi:hypothetical protein